MDRWVLADGSVHEHKQKEYNMKYTTKPIPLSYIKLNGGLNTAAGPLGVADNESPNLQNIDFEKGGSFGQRNGYTALNTSTIDAGQPIDGLYWFINTSISKPIAICNSKVYRMDTSSGEPDGTWDDITGAASITADKHFDFETFTGYALMTNDWDVPLKWSGAGNVEALDVPTGLTRAKFVTQFQNYCFLGNVVVSGVDRPSRFYFSALRDITSWNVAHFYEVSMEDGEEITGMKVLGDRLVVYKTNSIYIVTFTGNSDIPFVINKSKSSVGCIAPYSIQEIQNNHIFLAYDGVYMFDGNHSYKMTDKINPTINALKKTQLSNAVSMFQYDKNRYWLGVTSALATTNDTVLTWDSFNNAWSVNKGINACSMHTFLINGVEQRPYFGDYLGFVYRGDIGLDDYPSNVKTAITSYYWTNWKHFEDLTDSKGIPHVYIYHKDAASTLTFGYAYDFRVAADYTNTFSMNATGTPDSVIKRQDLTGRGRVVRFYFGNSTATETFQIDGIGMKAYLETYR